MYAYKHQHNDTFYDHNIASSSGAMGERGAEIEGTEKVLSNIF